MTEIRPFQAVHYNKEKEKDLNKVVCPPYDVISKEQQDAFYKESEHNFIRIMLGKEKPSDDKSNNRYTRAKNIYKKWFEQGILNQDDKPCIYFYKQEYKVLGQKYSRLGFISLMKLLDDGESKIFPHENTHSQAKEDRLTLWKALSSNLSSIFVCFSDKGRRVEKIFNQDILMQPPDIDVVDGDGVKHIVWRLDNPEKIQEIVDTLSEQQLFIADGHHRYEVSQELKRLRRSGKNKSAGNESFDYLMTYFTNMDSKDLQIFPMHRIVKKFSENLDFLDEFFRIDKVKSKDELVLLLAKAGKNEHSFGLYTKDGVKLLRLRNKLLIEKYVHEGSVEFKALDATILKHFVFDRIGVKSEDIIYTKDVSDVINMVDEGKAEAGFVMNPVKIQQLKDIALNGERMPPKTTYFYPKVLSGLTIHKMA